MANHAALSNFVRYSVEEVDFYHWFRTLGIWFNSLIPWLGPIFSLFFTVASSGFSGVINSYVRTMCNPPTPLYHGDVLIDIQILRAKSRMTMDSGRPSLSLWNLTAARPLMPTS